MTNANFKTVAKLYPMLEQGELSSDRLFQSGPISGNCICIEKQALLSAWAQVAEADPKAKHVDIGCLDASRVVRKVYEERLCRDLAQMAEPVLMEYGYEYRGAQRRKLMLSRGASEILALHFGSDETGKKPMFTSQQLAILERSGGLVGEFRTQELPAQIDISALLRQKLAAASAAAIV